MSYLKVFIISFILFGSVVYAENAPAPKKNSVEDIFIWKVSDELKLTATEEKKFAEIHRELNKQKMQLAARLQNLSFESKSDQTLTKSKASSIIKDYKKTLIAYNNLSLQELDKMKSLLGDKKFLEYLSIKQDITLKLKSLVLEESKAKPVKLPPPQIIEEK